MNILENISIENLENSPGNTLLNKLYYIKKDVFVDNDRIIFSCFSEVSTQTLHHIEWCCYYLDIPFFFVICNTNQIAVKEFFAQIDKDITLIEDKSIVPPLNNKSSAKPIFYNNSLCTHPWSGFHVYPDGSTSVCCDFEGKIGEYNIKKDSFEDILHSPEMSEIRKTFRDQGTPKQCNSCVKREKQGFKSKRNLVVHKHKNILKDINFESEGKLLFLGGHLGNLCNLKCRICSSMYSSSIAAEDVKFGTQSEKTKAMLYLKENVWTSKKNNIWQHIKKHTSLSNFEILGGETLLQRENLDYIQWLIDNNKSKDCIFEIVTNGTTIPDALKNQSHKFFHFNITVSIDNILDRFELERHGAKWDDVNKNIDMLLSLSNCSVSINITISLLNVYYLPEILDWLKEKNIDDDHCHINVLSYPSFMSIYSLKESFKISVIEKLKQYNDNKITPILKIVEAASLNDGMDFVKYMKNKDSIRREDFALSHPEVARCYYEQENEK
jgi:MoaA/NifB/PqqE/SkfB family radical SAM enzyme